MTHDLDVVYDALNTFRLAGLCTDRAELNRAWRDLTKPTEQENNA